MNKFILKLLWLSLPLYLPLSLFVIIDPFMLIGDNRGRCNIANNYNITINRDFQSTELFLRNEHSISYNSFILGSSRSFFYKVNVWKKYISGNCFHFNASSESLFGIERKLDFLNKKNINIKNVLIIIDINILSQTFNSLGHLFIKHPETSGESYTQFYKQMFMGFFNKSIIAHLDLFLTGKRKEYMKKYGIRNNVWKIDLNTNQLTYFKIDSIIKNNTEGYYKNKKNIFYDRDSIQLYSQPCLEISQKKILMSMSEILNFHNANFNIIISPLYNQKKISKEDLNYLTNLFGEENIHDFSGINEFTESIYNYYENSHYRPSVADKIMKEVYD